MGFGDFIKDYGPTVAWGIAIFGWAITNRQANNREKRKEFRAEIASIEDVLQTLIEKLESYFRMKLRDDEARKIELEVVMAFHSLDLMHERLEKRQADGELGLYTDVIRRYREELYDLATGSYFETEERIPSDQVHPRLQSLNAKVHLLVEALHSLFLAKFDSIRTHSVVGM
ncbi:hypothetical protein IFT68_03695 [Oxalobacteraceae sp. CFBP 13730]|nr:hypothetical protein [Oxalobacteraceae sp. CFBP 13730]